MNFEMQHLPGQGPAVHYRLRGELDIAVSREVCQDLRAARVQGRGPVVVDLSEVTFIDSSGLRALLLSASDGDAPSESPFVLAHASQAVRDILEMTGAIGMLTVVDDTSAYEWPNVN
jgi:anti-sigma B factor antagonist